MKAFRISGVIPLLIINPVTRWESDQPHAPVALPILNKDRCSQSRRLIWPLSRSGVYVGEKNSLPYLKYSFYVLNTVPLCYI